MAKKFVEHGKINDVTVKHPPGDNENSPYWDDYYAKKREGEDPRANPDVLEDKEENKLWRKRSEPTTEQSEILKELRNFDFTLILTPQEKQVIGMFVMKGIPLSEIHKQMNISRQRVNQIFTLAAKKIRKYLKLEEK